LGLADRGRQVVRLAMPSDHALLDQLLASLGGVDASRTAALARELTSLLDAPLNALTNHHQPRRLRHA
jgi:MarR family transcriptional regulator, organic hydroperoxide resistance regulator